MYKSYKEQPFIMSTPINLFKLFLLLVTSFILTACGGGGGNNEDNSGEILVEISYGAGPGGEIALIDSTIDEETVSFTVVPDDGFAIDEVTGCGGTLIGNIYETAPIFEDCTVVATFLPTYTVTSIAGLGGSISSTSTIVKEGDSTQLTVEADYGYGIDSVTGCSGVLNNNIYTTSPVMEDCTVSVNFVETGAVAQLSFEQIKKFSFSWLDVGYSTYYQILENIDGSSGFIQVGSDIPSGVMNYEHIVPLYARLNASYILRSCNVNNCIDSDIITINENLVSAIGYFKASNTSDLGSGSAANQFGSAVGLSANGTTLVIGSSSEGGVSSGINGDQTTESLRSSGAVYVFVLNNGVWHQQSYIKASNPDNIDQFGSVLGLSNDGNTLVVGAFGEDSDASGVNGDQSNNNDSGAGAAYVFVRNAEIWSQQAYLKASNPEYSDFFGEALSLSGDGNTIAVGARFENSDASGINGNQNNEGRFGSGAVYVFVRSGVDWSQQAYIKASNPGIFDFFGYSVSLSNSGDTLAVGAPEESSGATGIGGDESDNSVFDSGAVYVFTRVGNSWSQQEYIKASNTEANDKFGSALALSGDGSTLVVSAPEEDSSAVGINGDESDNSAIQSGAVYVFTLNNNDWTQQAYLKANEHNTFTSAMFGSSVSLSIDGNILAIGAPNDGRVFADIGGGNLTSSTSSGSAYTYARDNGVWNFESHIKSSNMNSQDQFGENLGLSNDGKTLGIGASFEDSNAQGINGDQENNDTLSAGAVYLY